MAENYNLTVKKLSKDFDVETLLRCVDGYYNTTTGGYDGQSYSSFLENTNTQYLLKYAPEIKFSHLDNFDFEFVYNIRYVGSTSLTYDIYALTNNKTILQYVGYLELRKSGYSSDAEWDTGYYSLVNEPNETYGS